ncbi:MAG: dockerin type I repeat-containing protein, partial [Candidatus Omnitrophica bacterium]|nr:dockerin type I repeat-containing protein [Candidatus Omnitrophota bacterium]
VLSSWGLKKGTGFAGKTTIAKLNMIYGCTTQPETSGCQTLWWYDEGSNQYCQQKQFCGAYMYLGLHTFTTEETCKTSLRLEGTATSTPPCSSCGDVDLDRDVDLIDASLISNYAAKTIGLSEGQKFRGDVNGDGKTNIVDATTITQYVEGTISNFLVCQGGWESSDSGWEKKADDIALPEELQNLVDNLRKKTPGSPEYVDKIEYALRDAYADLFNGKVRSGNVEDTTAYRHAFGMLAVRQSYDIAVEQAGYTQSFENFICNSCHGYSYINAPIYKMIDGSPVVVPGAKVYDPSTHQWIVFDEWGKSARLATELEAAAYEHINNQATEFGDDHLNMIATYEMIIRASEEWIETAEKRIEIIDSGGPVSDMWGTKEYLQAQIDRNLEIIKNANGNVAFWEAKYRAEVGELPPNWRNINEQEGDGIPGGSYVPPMISDSDAYYWDQAGGFPGTGGSDYNSNDSGGGSSGYNPMISDSDAYYWDKAAAIGNVKPNFDWQEAINFDPFNPDVEIGENTNDKFYTPPPISGDESYVPLISDSDEYWALYSDKSNLDWNSGNAAPIIEYDNTGGSGYSPCPACQPGYNPGSFDSVSDDNGDGGWDPDEDLGDEDNGDSNDSGDESDDDEYDPNDMTDEERDWGDDDYWLYTFKNIEENLASISGAVIRLAEGIKEFLSR